MCVHLCSCVCTHECKGPQTLEKGNQITLELELQENVSHSIWVLRLKLSEAIKFSRSL